MNESEKIWWNGKLVPWGEAKIHVLSHVVHYGSSCFEGIRCYKTPEGSRVFRLQEHMRRLLESAKIYRLDVPYDKPTLVHAVLDTIRENGLEACYVRPIIFRGYGSLSVSPAGVPIETCIAVWEWGAYLGKDALESGVDVCVSSWSRAATNTFPTAAKAGGHYLNSQLIKMEAIQNGYSEGIALDPGGYVSEGSGENIFLVRDGVAYTPALAHSVLAGVTRDAVIRIAVDLGIKVRERAIPREWLYIADELFFTGTAAEITPIRSVDRLPVGGGRRGPVTEKIQARFFEIINGKAPDPDKWLTRVPR
jgi:branched-chain amino acid aminotransferase